MPAHERAPVGELDVFRRGLETCAPRSPTSLSRNTAAVADTAPASIEPLRLPPVPGAVGVSAVSPWIVVTSSIGTPSASAVSWTTVVSRLLPVEPPATYTLTLPDGSMRIVAPSLP